MRIAPLPQDWRAWPLVIAALVLLNASLTFANVWPTPKIRWQPALSVELAGCVLLLALLGARAPLLAKTALPAVWLALAAGRYLDVTGPALYGRAFNLYWDSPHLWNVVAMITDSVPGWVLALSGAGVLLAGGAAFVTARLAFSWVAQAAARQRMRRPLAGAAAGVVLAFVLVPPPEPGRRGVFVDPVTPAYGRQVRSVLAMIGPGAAAPALGASPAALAADLSPLAGADVLLVFVESYGAVTFDDPGMADALAGSRRAFEDAVRETGRQVVSAFVESPTFGASSWLAHLTLLSGVEVRDQYSYQALMTQERPTLARTFSRAGYRAVALMPGMRQPWPEGAFYGYDTIYGRRDLEYTGPQFGWWSIPDQYALAKLDALEGPPGSRPPLFAVFPTSTTHAPFGPVAPYQPDWSRVLTDDAYDPAEVERILARPPDLTNLAREYTHAMAYEFATFAGYLRTRRADDLIMILIGDHQPPAAVAGNDLPWTVPVHVVSSRANVIEALLANGFGMGLRPERPSLGGMHALVPVLLGAVGE